MTTDLETRLSAHYRHVADQLVLPDVTFDEVVARASDARVTDTTGPVAGRGRSPAVRSLAIAAALLLFVVGLASVTRRGDDSASTPVDRPSTLLSTVDEIGDDEWVIAGPLPPDVVYMYSTRIERDRTVAYGNERESGTFERLRISIGRPPLGDGVQTVDIAGAEWTLDTPVSVSDSGAFDQDDRDLLAGS